jgi:hypothetical protein
MMYVSRHIYLLGAALVNLVLGLYLQMKPPRWRGILQQIGSLLILLRTGVARGICGRTPAGHCGAQLAKFFRLDRALCRRDDASGCKCYT